MTYEYLEHEADAGIKACGSTLEEAFEEGARAMFGIMIKLNSVESKSTFDIECRATSLETLFVEWLNELLAIKDIEHVFFCNFHVSTITQDGGEYVLEAKAEGESINLIKHFVKTEVKAATYSGLRYTENNGLHCLQCVVDV